MTSLDSFKCRKTLKVGSKTYVYYSLPTAEKNGLKGISKLPYSMKVLLENLMRNEDGRTVKKDDIVAVSKWLRKRKLEHEVAFRPARVLMQDFTGVPAVVDLAAMRNAMQKLGGDAEKINPLVPVDLVIDHSVIVNFFGDNKAFAKNVVEEYKQNQERYEFLKWGQKAFSNFSVVPPGTGICHQVNLEYLAQTVWTKKEKMTVGRKTGTFEVAYPDSLVGTDSHTTMVNGLAVLGWGVGGIEAEACMLGQPLSMLLPEVVGFRLKGQLKEGVTATDLVLTVTQTPGSRRRSSCPASASCARSTPSVTELEERGAPRGQGRRDPHRRGRRRGPARRGAPREGRWVRAGGGRLARTRAALRRRDAGLHAAPHGRRAQGAPRAVASVAWAPCSPGRVAHARLDERRQLRTVATRRAAASERRATASPRSRPARLRCRGTDRCRATAERLRRSR